MRASLFPAIFSLALLCCNTAKAQQSIDLITVSGQFSPEVPYLEVPGKARETTGLVNLKLPVVFKNEKTIWYSDLTYNYSSVSSTANFGDSVFNPIQLHGFILQTGWVQKLSSDRAIQLLFAPRLMSDFQNMDGRSLQLGAVGLFEKKFSNKLLMRFGAMYNQDLFSSMLVPLIYLDWNVGNSKWNISGLVPIYAKIGYKFNDRFTAGIAQFGLVTSYALGGEGYAGDYMERKSIDLTAFGRYRLAGNLHLEARVGYALSRDYAQYDEDDKMDFRITVISIGDDRVRKNVRFEDGLIANLRLVYNLPLN